MSEAKLIKHEGIKKGLILLGPFSVKVSLALAIDCKPPIPEPIKTPALLEVSSSNFPMSASFIAWSAAAIAYKIKSSIFL